MKTITIQPKGVFPAIVLTIPLHYAGLDEQTAFTGDIRNFCSRIACSIENDERLTKKDKIWIANEVIRMANIE